MFPMTKVLYCSLQLRLSCSFFFDQLLQNLGSLGHCRSSGHLLLHESQVLILLAKACQLILDDFFDLLFWILLRVFLSFDVLLLGCVLSG
jgi:hypothetical protein